jgi:hypothetical protein
MLLLTTAIKRIGESELLTMPISESSPFLSASGSEATSLSGDNFPGGGTWNPKKKKEKESQKRIQKIRKKETSSHCGKKLSFSIFAQQIPQDQINHTHKEAYTHHEINAKLFLPSSIRCQLTGEK